MATVKKSALVGLGAVLPALGASMCCILPVATDAIEKLGYEAELKNPSKPGS